MLVGAGLTFDDSSPLAHQLIDGIADLLETNAGKPAKVINTGEPVQAGASPTQADLCITNTGGPVQDQHR
jgi:hypothetical protein